jgi:hypothetical protein
MNLPTRKVIPFDRPAVYQIVVQGRIDPNMSDLLGGMAIHTESDESDNLITILKGGLRDQAALAGVLNSLYELHRTVMLVERLNT